MNPGSRFIGHRRHIGRHKSTSFSSLMNPGCLRHIGWHKSTSFSSLMNLLLVKFADDYDLSFCSRMFGMISFLPYQKKRWCTSCTYKSLIRPCIEYDGKYCIYEWNLFTTKVLDVWVKISTEWVRLKYRGALRYRIQFRYQMKDLEEGSASAPAANPANFSLSIKIFFFYNINSFKRCVDHYIRDKGYW